MSVLSSFSNAIHKYQLWCLLDKDGQFDGHLAHFKCVYKGTNPQAKDMGMWHFQDCFLTFMVFSGLQTMKRFHYQNRYRGKPNSSPWCNMVTCAKDSDNMTITWYFTATSDCKLNIFTVLGSFELCAPYLGGLNQLGSVYVLPHLFTSDSMAREINLLKWFKIMLESPIWNRLKC